MTAAMDRSEAERLLAGHGWATPPFSLKGRATWGRVVRVHDGDSLTLVVPLDGDRFHRFSIRLAGIDACELQGDDPAVRDRAMRARERLVELCATAGGVADSLPPPEGRARFWEDHVCLVWAECHRTDKYGRVLATIRSDPDDTGPSFGERLCAEHLAFPYTGGGRLPAGELLAAMDAAAAGRGAT